VLSKHDLRALNAARLRVAERSILERCSSLLDELMSIMHLLLHNLILSTVEPLKLLSLQDLICVINYES